MTFNEYSEKATELAVYSGQGQANGLMYTTLGLCGEVGEFCEKIKKIIHENDGKLNQVRYGEVAKELGDVMWYMATVVNELNAWHYRSTPTGGTCLDMTFDDIARMNIEKLTDRAARGVLHGEGDNR